MERTNTEANTSVVTLRVFVPAKGAAIVIVYEEGQGRTDSHTLVGKYLRTRTIVFVVATIANKGKKQ